MLPRAATEFYALHQRVNATAANEVRRLWGLMGDDFDASWRRIGPSILDVLAAAQEEVARGALRYVPQVLAETDLPNRPSGSPQLASFVGMASDGRPLQSLAYGAVAKAKIGVGDGQSTRSALDGGGNWIDLMTKLQVADTARQVVGVMTAARKDLGGTIRVLNPPSCQRCAILAGRFYRWSTGFQRHPRCDCVNLPSASAGWAKSEGFLTDPMDAYRRGEIRDLTDAQRAAIDNGADISSVVNATRGMSTTVTHRPIGRSAARTLPNDTLAPVVAHGMPDLLAGVRAQLATRVRSAEGFLTPEGIYRQARTREEAIELLRHWGYLT
jgi:hypothetical protein